MTDKENSIRQPKVNVTTHHQPTFEFESPDNYFAMRRTQSEREQDQLGLHQSNIAQLHPHESQPAEEPSVLIVQAKPIANEDPISKEIVEEYPIYIAWLLLKDKGRQLLFDSKFQGNYPASLRTQHAQRLSRNIRKEMEKKLRQLGHGFTITYQTYTEAMKDVAIFRKKKSEKSLPPYVSIGVCIHAARFCGSLELFKRGYKEFCSGIYDNYEEGQYKRKPKYLRELLIMLSKLWSALEDPDNCFEKLYTGKIQKNREQHGPRYQAWFRLHEFNILLGGVMDLRMKNWKRYGYLPDPQSEGIRKLEGQEQLDEQQDSLQQRKKRKFKDYWETK